MTQRWPVGSRHKQHRSPFDVVVIFVLTILVLLIAIPVYLALVTSFITEASYIKQPVQFLPQELTLANYAYCLENLNLLTSYGNSIINTVLSMCYGLFCTVTMGYGLSFKDFPGRKAIFLFLVITMFFGGGLLPDYLLAKNLGLINTRWAVIL